MLKLLTFFQQPATLQRTTMTSSTYVIQDRRQLVALASSARQEIVDVLPRLGAASVAEIADALGRPADGLYYHLRGLQRVGLVVEAGARRVRGRSEVLYRTIAQTLALRQEPRSIQSSRATGKIVASMLRLGIRDYRASIQDPDVRLSGDERELWALRTTGWLSMKQLGAVNALVRRMIHDVSRPSRKGSKLYAVTLLLTPLDYRHRKKQHAK